MTDKKQRTAIIIGAGPAGLTAAYELLKRTDIKPIVYESTIDIGGLSKTIEYKGNRIDIGGHRFFSKSDRVMQWWQNILPVLYSSQNNKPLSIDRLESDNVLLIRNRISRILYLRRLFDYPISLSLKTAKNLGYIRLGKAGLSYLWTCIYPKRDENNLEDFLINRFGKHLYRTFFKDYTEKVWGVPCSQIKPEWGAQRIKGLSVAKALLHAIKKPFLHKNSIAQKNTETTLIERFLYPKYGPGQMWESVAAQIREMGGEIRLGHSITGMHLAQNAITEVMVQSADKKQTEYVGADYVLSSMPVKELVLGIKGSVPQEVIKVAEGLIYRDFITVGLLLSQTDKSSIKANEHNHLKDNWIYIQEADLKIGRLQIFNNWSPYMVRNPEHLWIGLEYFCNQGDELWTLTDQEMASLGAIELNKTGLFKQWQIIDSTVIRMPKAYPAYFGSYEHFNIVRRFTDRIGNLYLIGRNGMHSYNNQDHSMLTAMTAVDTIISGSTCKGGIWAVNTEKEYHETK